MSSNSITIQFPSSNGYLPYKVYLTDQGNYDSWASDVATSTKEYDQAYKKITANLKQSPQVADRNWLETKKRELLTLPRQVADHVKKDDYFKSVTFTFDSRPKKLDDLLLLFVYKGHEKEMPNEVLHKTSLVSDPIFASLLLGRVMTFESFSSGNIASLRVLNAEQKVIYTVSLYSLVDQKG